MVCFWVFLRVLFCFALIVVFGFGFGFVIGFEGVLGLGLFGCGLICLLSVWFGLFCCLRCLGLFLGLWFWLVVC